jgi:hypothetical protein
MDWFKSQYYENWEAERHAMSRQHEEKNEEDDEDEERDREADDSVLQLRPNDFTNLSDYMLKKALPLLLSQVRSDVDRGDGTHTSCTPPDLVHFLSDLLRDNDNSHNPFSDVFYLGSLMEACGNLKVASGESIAPLKAEIMRYLNYDQVVPSYRYILTQQAIMAIAKLERGRQLGHGGSDGCVLPYESYAGPAHDRGVRLAAFKALLMVLPIKRHLLHTALTIAEEEAMPGMSEEMIMQWARQVARGVCPARLFRTQTEENSKFMNRLWNMMKSEQTHAHAHLLTHRPAYEQTVATGPKAAYDMGASGCCSRLFLCFSAFFLFPFSPFPATLPTFVFAMPATASTAASMARVFPPVPPPSSAQPPTTCTCCTSSSANRMKTSRTPESAEP